MNSSANTHYVHTMYMHSFKLSVMLFDKFNTEREESAKTNQMTAQNSEKEEPTQVL